MTEVHVIEEDRSSDERPWEPPLWLVTLGVFAALVVGLIVSSAVHDPRLTAQPTPTPCPAPAVVAVPGSSLVWTFCR